MTDLENIPAVTGPGEIVKIKQVFDSGNMFLMSQSSSTLKGLGNFWQRQRWFLSTIGTIPAIVSLP